MATASRVKDAAELWGLPAAEAEGRLRESLGRGWRVAAIGPAGEARRALRDDLPRRAARRARRAGRGDGRQAAQGDRGPRHNQGRVGGSARVLAAARDLRARSFGPATAKYRELGTLANLLAFNAISTLPTRNFQAATFAGAPRLAAEDLAELRGVARNSCASCTIGCEHIYSARGKKVRVEYENVFALGPMCGVRTPMPCSPPAAGATSWGWTPSQRAARSRGRWSAPSGA